MSYAEVTALITLSFPTLIAFCDTSSIVFEEPCLLKPQSCLATCFYSLIYLADTLIHIDISLFQLNPLGEGHPELSKSRIHGLGLHGFSFHVGLKAQLLCVSDIVIKKTIIKRHSLICLLRDPV